MLLVDDRKIKLDDDIRKFLPYVPPSRHEVTVHHLLQHTSGLDEALIWDKDDETWESLFGRFDELPLLLSSERYFRVSSSRDSFPGFPNDAIANALIGLLTILATRREDKKQCRSLFSWLTPAG